MFKLFMSPGEMGGEVQADAEPAEVVETTTTEPEKDPAKAFAARLGHERKKIESEFAPYRDVIDRQAKASGMSSEEYLTYIRDRQEQEALEEEAEKTGKSPEVLRVEQEKKDIESRLAQYEKKERLTTEEKELISDPKIGKFVSDNLDKIRELAETTNTNLKTGLAIIAAEKLPELISLADPEAQRDKIIKEYLEGVKRGAKPIEIGGGSPSPGEKQPKTFAEARTAALEMLKSIKQ